MKTTAKDFSIFKKECQKWIDFFGLKEYRVHYEHSSEYTDCVAFCVTDQAGGCATLGLIKDVGYERNNLAIRESAFHEVCELLLSKMCHIARDRAFCEEELTCETHSIIRRLENTVFK